MSRPGTANVPRVYIEKVIKTGENRYDLYAKIVLGEKSYLLYIPKLSRHPDEVRASTRGENIVIDIVSRGEGFCTCILDSNKISSGCISIRCVSPIGVWIADEEKLRSHRVAEI